MVEGYNHGRLRRSCGNVILEEIVEEDDSTGGPKPERGNKGAWPTLVIEAGDSDSLGELHNDMKWWFSASDHQVKLEEEVQTHPGATTTRRFAGLQPTLRQSITIAQNATTNPVSYNVTRGALILSFRLLHKDFFRTGLGQTALSRRTKSNRAALSLEFDAQLDECKTKGRDAVNLFSLDAEGTNKSVWGGPTLAHTYGPVLSPAHKPLLLTAVLSTQPRGIE
ncbi:hypothetical protein B0H66DRAFT_529149 [Apodospora peruviana]|uniref:Uncharacterized protein n=1 Tax=Apodospora peruviana TaxID=516989 RepID=A0AAE0IHM8_9PEZI|nr:hypothetical protein B0H66DRAFT_529149 [Apodospora peruviana]